MRKTVVGKHQVAQTKMISCVKLQKVTQYEKKFWVNFTFLETKPPLMNEPSGTCPNSDWVPYGKNCYLFERIARSYGDAKFDCSTRSIKL